MGKKNVVDELLALELNTSISRLKKLGGFELKGRKIYGGVAFLGTSARVSENEIVQHIEENGLFGVKIIGKSSCGNLRRNTACTSIQ